MNKSISGIAVAAMLFGPASPVFASDGISGAPASAQGINYHHMPGPDMAADGSLAPNGVVANEYLFLAGSAFTPRTSTQTVTYPSSGCSNSSAALTTSLELPQGASILGVRLFYYNSGTPSDVGLFLTTYPGDGSSIDQLTGNSTLNTGYSSEYFNLAVPVVVDNISRAHVLTGVTGGVTRLCGMRVFYSP